MISTFLMHPLTTFLAGGVLAIVAAGLLLNSCAGPNTTAATVGNYQKILATTRTGGPAAGSPAEQQAVGRFTGLLTHISDPAYIRENTTKTYAPDAYLNDTLVTKHGADEIQAYFLDTSAAMQDYKVTIDDVSRSGPDHYVRWTMIVSAKALDKGHPVHSVGISQVRFDAEGKVVLHQDFWDAGENFFGKLPVAGGVISIIRKRLGNSHP